MNRSETAVLGVRLPLVGDGEALVLLSNILSIRYEALSVTLGVALPCTLSFCNDSLALIGPPPDNVRLCVLAALDAVAEENRENICKQHVYFSILHIKYWHANSSQTSFLGVIWSF